MMHVSAVLVLGHIRLPRFLTGVHAPLAQSHDATPLEAEIYEIDPTPHHEENVARDPMNAANPSGALARNDVTNSARLPNDSRAAPNDAPSSAPASNEIIAGPSDTNWTFNVAAPGSAHAAPNLYAGALNGLATAAPPPRDEDLHRSMGLPAIRPSKSGGLIEALDANDKEKSMGRGGPVLAAVEDAAHSADAPAEGFAEYEVVVSRSGGVKVAFLGASDHHESWAKITAEIERGVSSRHVRIPDSTTGMKFVVRVEAVVQYPDGKRPADIGNSAIATTDSTNGRPGLSFQRVPMVGVYHSGKVCSAGAVITPGMPMIGGGCSPENIGQPAARIVHGRLVSEDRLD